MRPRTAITHDVFISYAHANEKEADLIIQNLRREKEGIRLFVDRENLGTGGVWQHQLFMALDSCQKVVALLSPEFVASSFCVEEFNIAMLRSRSEGQEILYPVYLFSATLPRYIRARQWSDCSEGDTAKLEATCRNLVKELKAAT